MIHFSKLRTNISKIACNWAGIGNSHRERNSGESEMHQLSKSLAGSALVAVAMMGQAHATCTSYPYTLTNGSTADASQVMANFNCAALTSGATINSVTLTGTTTFPGSSAI